MIAPFPALKKRAGRHSPARRALTASTRPKIRSRPRLCRAVSCPKGARPCRAFPLIFAPYRPASFFENEPMAEQTPRKRSLSSVDQCVLSGGTFIARAGRARNTRLDRREPFLNCLFALCLRPVCPVRRSGLNKPFRGRERKSLMWKQPPGHFNVDLL